MKYFEKLLLLLFMLTLIAVLAEEKILQTTITITPNAPTKFAAFADNDSSGNSTVKVISSNDAFHWLCIIENSSIAHPFCALEITLGENREQGIDLSNFSTLKLWLSYIGEADTIRIFLRNFEKNYSTVNDYTSTKYNGLDINIEHLTPGLAVKLSYFNVPSWWQLERRLSPARMAPEFYNIVSLDIQTGSDVSEGVHEFRLEKIELQGQWLTTEKWYLGILFIWMLVMVIKVIHHQLQLLSKIELSTERELELIKINTHLDKQGRKLQEKVEKDKLTGAFNRAGAELKLADALQEKQDDGFIFSIILLDIDHFKKINDTYGHDAGDKILVDISTLIQNNIRASDYFARWGGEEFMIICRKTSLTTATDIAEQLRESISTSILIGDIMVTASMGVAEISGDDQTAINDAFKRADQALYKAKNSGRNKVEVAHH